MNHGIASVVTQEVRLHVQKPDENQTREHRSDTDVNRTDVENEEGNLTDDGRQTR